MHFAQDGGGWIEMSRAVLGLDYVHACLYLYVFKIDATRTKHSCCRLDFNPVMM